MHAVNRGLSKISPWNYIINKLSKLRSHLVYIASRNKAQIWINSDIWLYSLIDYSAHAWHIISKMSRATEITTSRRGDVTNARDKQTVLCPLLISNYWTGGCCDCGCAWFYCLLRSYKSTFQLCGLSEHVDVAFITNQKWVWFLSDCYVLWKVLVQVLFEAGGLVLSCVLVNPKVFSYVSITYNLLPLYA